MNFSYTRAENYTFGGVDQNFEKARVVILPVPYSSTTYWDPNTKFGPQALIEASRHMELYDLELKMDIAENTGIYTLPELSCSKNSPEEAVKDIASAIKEIIDKNKFPLVLGGEHLISLGAISQLKKKYHKLTVLQLDAHTDLRNRFEGTRFHHACVMRRVVEDLGLRVVQVGIRSVSSEEARFIKKTRKNDIYYAPDMPIEEIISLLGQDVYITFDLDFLDPAYMESTGTPEPGGYDWYQTISILKAVCKQRRIIGADVVELSPKPNIKGPDFLAAKLAYKLIGYSHLLSKL